MNKHENELLEKAEKFKENLTYEQFKSRLRGFRQVGTESDKLKKALDELLENN